MDTALLDVLGFSCQCLAVPEDQNVLWSWIAGKSKQFPLPRTFKPQPQQSPATERMDIEPTDKPLPKEQNEIDVSALYLTKASAGRAFVPNGGIDATRTSATNDFISLGDMKVENIRPAQQLVSMSRKTEKPITKTIPNKPHVPFDRFSGKKKFAHQSSHSNKVSYLPLKVNRVQPNHEKVRNKNNKKNKNKNK